MSWLTHTHAHMHAHTHSSNQPHNNIIITQTFQRLANKVIFHDLVTCSNISSFHHRSKHPGSRCPACNSTEPRPSGCFYMVINWCLVSVSASLAAQGKVNSSKGHSLICSAWADMCKRTRLPVTSHNHWYQREWRREEREVKTALPLLGILLFPVSSICCFF